MTLLGTLGLSANALNAASLGLQVTGNNIANANTPDYIRQRLVQTPTPPQRLGGLLLGLGVDIEGVVQVVDRFLEERLRNATSDVATTDVQADAYSKLEAALNELGDSDLSTSLTNFFGSIHDVLNQPESTSVRNVVVQQGRALTETIRRIDQHVRGLAQDANGQIASMADEINGLLEEVARLNVQIVQAEGGAVLHSDAVGLRDRRGAALGRLSELLDIRTIEQPTGDVVVFSGGEYLVSLGQARSLEAVTSVEDGLQVTELQVADIGIPVVSAGGKLGGLIIARDEILRGFLNDFDAFASTLIQEFNKVYSGGQGLVGYRRLTSEHGVSNSAAALDAAGLPFAPTTGLFQVQVTSGQSGQRRTVDVHIDLDGLDNDTTLTALAAQLDAIDGLAASITPDGRLEVRGDAPEVAFAFAGDTSGVLAALGLSTFFTGTRASDIGIQSTVRSDPRTLAISQGGVGLDTQNGAALANLLTAPLAAHDDASLATLYDRLNSRVALGAQTARGAAEGFRHFEQTLRSQHLAISGVNIDEEAVKLIGYQRAFQAAARVISTVNGLLDTLLNL
jgi:flagellar hook-associated protein 1 FlgK